MTEIDIDAATRFMASTRGCSTGGGSICLCGTGDAVSMLGCARGLPQSRRRIRVGDRARRSFAREPAGRRAACVRGVRRSRPDDLAVCGRAVRLARVRDARRRRAAVRTTGRRSRRMRAVLGRAPTPRRPSLHITAAVCSMAHRVAAHDPDVAAHPWLAAATDYCLGEIDAITETPHAIALMYILHFLDAMVDSHPEIELTLRQVVADHLPSDGSMHVAGGLEDECLEPLDFSPYPDRPLRALIDPDAIESDLDRWAAGQQRRRRLDASTSPATRRSPPSNGADTPPCAPHTAARQQLIIAAQRLKRRSRRYPGNPLFRGSHRLDRRLTESHRSR